MWRSSSPGEYSLCSENSTDEPCTDARWRPDSAPSTITRALIGSEPRRLSCAGSIRFSNIDGLRRDDGQQPVDELAGALPFGLGAIVEDQAVLQRRPCERGDVFD